jgi:hypothetical protein
LLLGLWLLTQGIQPELDCVGIDLEDFPEVSSFGPHSQHGLSAVRRVAGVGSFLLLGDQVGFDFLSQRIRPGQKRVGAKPHCFEDRFGFVLRVERHTVLAPLVAVPIPIFLASEIDSL